MKLLVTALRKKKKNNSIINILKKTFFFYLLEFCFFEFDRKKFLNDRDIELYR
jgi:hypothetical protein